MPPKLFHRFFLWYCHPGLVDRIEGDLLEVYRENVIKLGKRQADIKFAVDVLLLFRKRIIKPVEGYKNLNTYGMYKNYLKTAWRNLTGRKLYAAINIAGLALGIACALLIYSLVTYHLSFDNFHSNADRIYRFVTEEHRDQIDYSAAVPPAFGNAFREDYTFGEKVARVCIEDEMLITLEENGARRKFEERIVFVEPEYFDIFNFPLVAGKRKGLLAEPNTAVITERIAKKYFGDEPALGKTFLFNNQIHFTITGVLRNIPDNTDLQGEIYFSYSTMKQFNEWYASDAAWGGITDGIQTFVLLQRGVNPAEVEKVLTNYVTKYRPKSKNVHHYKLQPLHDVHFNPKYYGKIDKSTLWVLALVGFLMIFTACLNFINLATAQASTRSKEVGVRKVMGSARAQLFWQFTIETGLIVVVATAIALSVSFAVLPSVNAFFDTHAVINFISDPSLSVFLLGLIIMVTFLAGAYPGVILSGFRPALALKGKLQERLSGSFNIRRGLTITQFTITQVLLIGLIVVVYQMKHFASINMGFNRDAMVMIPVGSDDIKQNTLKQQFLTIPHVENVSVCFAAPASDNYWGTSLRFDNRTEVETFSISFRGADENYLSTFGIKLLAGRNLTPSDTVREFLVNEMTLSKLGLTSPEEILGRTIAVSGQWTGPVVGVVGNFYEESLRTEIGPVFITTSMKNYNSYAVKIDMADLSNTLIALEKAWSNMYPDLIYKYDFLDDQIASFYREEQALMTMIQVFAGIALVIGCMGLYGLVSFMAIQKTKEIGIRKVLGGNVSQILWIFGKEFSRLVLIAFLIAAPIGWMLMSNWLSGYVNPVQMGIWMLVLELAIVGGVVVLTVGFRSIKAAVANPVESLRSE